MKITPVLFAALLVAGCASQAPLPQDAKLPQQVISMAAEAAPNAVRTTVALEVHAVGIQKGITYLNSEADYRDQRNVSIAIPAQALKNVEAAFGGPLADVAKGKHILVSGAAQRVKIFFIDSAGLQSDKYYYQTHLVVTDPAQIRII